MVSGKYEEINYCIYDPTGNITALVETLVEAADRASVAAGIMAGHPEVEQVGFVVFDDARDADVSLMMAGGEFCGNATMCAASLYALRRGLPAAGAVRVRVSGAEAPLTVHLTEDGSGAAAVTLPPAIGLISIPIEPAASYAAPASPAAANTDAASLPLVRLQGIDHIIIEPDSACFGLKDDPAAAEKFIRERCRALGSDCLGMMFLAAPAASGAAAGATLTLQCRMTPLVYVPGADTLFWENSCASGSAAAGIWLANKAGSPVDVTLVQPAGSLRVESDPATGRTVLHGTARLLTQATYKC